MRLPGETSPGRKLRRVSVVMTAGRPCSTLPELMWMRQCADGSTAVIDRRTRRKVAPTADPTPAIRRIAHGPSQNEVEGRMNWKTP
jgi:hypothetical protein